MRYTSTNYMLVLCNIARLYVKKGRQVDLKALKAPEHFESGKAICSRSNYAHNVQIFTNPCPQNSVQ